MDNRSLLESLTRIVIVLSAGAALVCQLSLAARGWHGLPWMGAAAFGIGLLAGWRSMAAGYALVLGSAYLWPVLVYFCAGIQPAFAGVWLSAALGLAIGASRTVHWSLPPAWHLLLSLTGLAIALTWPVIAWRELDFTFAVLSDERQAVTWQGIFPAVEIVWITAVAAAHLVGLLWVDALVARFQSDAASFRRLVLWPLAGAAAVAAAVSLYQLTVDITFLNPTTFAGLKRATGTMLDANAFGLVAAIWSGGAAWLVAESGSTGRRMGGVVVAVIFALAVWASGSRTALSALIVTLASLGAVMFGSVRRGDAQRRSRLIVIGAALMLLAFIAGAAFFSNAVGPLARLRERPHGIAVPLLTELRDRGGYGTTARVLIDQFPVTGGGVGSFHTLVVDYSRIYTDTWLTPDNAQNWFRHQLAELGWLGTAGYFLWAAAFAVFAVRAVGRRGAYTPRVVAGVLGGIVTASILGMPTQDPVVLLTFWTMVAWLLFSTNVVPPLAPVPGARRTTAWTAVWLVAITFTASTAYSAVNHLRVPFRAAATGWDYRYGIHALDASTRPYFRWTGLRAVTVVRAKGQYLVLRFRIQHPDAAANPVNLKIKLFNQTIVRERLRDHAAVTRYVKMSPLHPFVVLSFEVSRTFQAAGTDPRQLGLAVDDWTFVDSPPADAWVVDSPTAFPPRRNPYN